MNAEKELNREKGQLQNDRRKKLINVCSAYVRNTPSALAFPLHVGVKSLDTSQEKKNIENFNTLEKFSVSWQQMDHRSPLMLGFQTVFFNLNT